MTPGPEVDDDRAVAHDDTGVQDEAVGPTGPAALLAEARRDVLAASVLAVVVGVAGLLLGVLWALTAPAELVVVAAGGAASLTDEAGHLFDATALFALLAMAFGVLAGAVAWRLRAHRGPLMLIAAVVGALAGAYVAAWLGTAIAPGSAPVAVLLDRARAAGDGVPGPPVPATLATVPASLGSWWTVTLAGLGAALGYLLPAIWLGAEGLDRDA